MLAKIINWARRNFERVSIKLLGTSSLPILRLLSGYEILSIVDSNGCYELNGRSGEKLYISRLVRLPKYRSGISKRLFNLQQDYLTSTLQIPRDECVIDIGANIGEFGLFWKSKNYKIYSFEPDPVEFDALSENLIDHSIYNFGLWNSTTTLTFYCANDSGDSSLIRPASFKSEVKLDVYKLDEIEISGPIGLIKLEAEGAEPEILEGAINTLRKTRYVTVDVGEERGVSGESTLVDVCNFMFANGFGLMDFNPKRLVVLFTNLNLSN
jgi:FkbM family methyltransferase